MATTFNDDAEKIIRNCSESTRKAAVEVNAFRQGSYADFEVLVGTITRELKRGGPELLLGEGHRATMIGGGSSERGVVTLFGFNAGICKRGGFYQDHGWVWIANSADGVCGDSIFVRIVPEEEEKKEKGLEGVTELMGQMKGVGLGDGNGNGKKKGKGKGM